MISPRPPNNPKSRETFGGNTGILFDPLSPAASSVAMSLAVLLEPSRATRLAQAGAPGLVAVTEGLLNVSWYSKPAGGTTGLIQRQTNVQVLHALLGLAFDPRAGVEARAIALDAVNGLDSWLARQSPRDSVLKAHYRFARFEIQRLQADPAQIERLKPVVVPPGSPIGS